MKSPPSPDYVGQQIEEHLILGPVYRRGQSLQSGFIALVLLTIAGEIYYRQPFMAIAESSIAWIVTATMLRRLSPQKQVRGAWWVLKTMPGLIGFIYILRAVPAYFQGDTQWWLGPLFGLIIMPGPEFIPSIRPYQKFLTVIRLILGIYVGNLVLDHFP